MGLSGSPHAERPTAIEECPSKGPGHTAGRQVRPRAGGEGRGQRTGGILSEARLLPNCWFWAEGKSVPWGTLANIWKLCWVGSPGGREVQL